MHLRDGPTSLPSVALDYRRLADSGAITRDPAQERLAAALDRLIVAIDTARLAAKSSALGWLFARGRPAAGAPKGPTFMAASAAAKPC
jgi:cell division protein ZapE